MLTIGNERIAATGLPVAMQDALPCLSIPATAVDGYAVVSTDAA